LRGDLLLDTSVLSLLAPGRPQLPAKAIAVLRAKGDGLFISTITVMEIQQGIEKLRRSPDRAERAADIDRWLAASLHEFGERVLPFDEPCAREAGRLSDRAFASGRHPGFADIAIAATAAVHQLTILTSNIRHFAPLGVACRDPFESSS